VATVALASSPTVIDGGSAPSMQVVNTGNVDVYLSTGTRLRPGQSTSVDPSGAAVTAKVMGSVAGQVTTTKAPSVATLGQTTSLSHIIDYTNLTDGSSVTQFDTGQKYTQANAGGSNAIVQYGSLTPPNTNAGTATYEFARNGNRRVRTVGMSFRFWTATGGTTSPTVACGLFGPTATNPANSPAHLAVTRTTWQLLTITNNVFTLIPGATGNHNLAVDTTYRMQVAVDYAAGTVTAWLPATPTKPVTFESPNLGAMIYPTAFSEMVLNASTDLFPQTFSWWADVERPYGIS
jgi:hypothetical protein